MTRSTGQNPGRRSRRAATPGDGVRHEGGDGAALPGLSWADLLAAVIEAHGTLTAVAWRLIEHAEGDDVASVERALRRLRTRGQRDGGVWGQRLLRRFGVPEPIERRVRWMGVYHSPFNDLPVALCLDQLRLWDRPPISASRARIWLHLGRASHALRIGEIDEAEAAIARATEAVAALPADYDAARIELALVGSFVASRRDDPAAVVSALDRAAALLATATLSDHDRACFEARLVDQRAYQLNRAGDHAAALALFEALPGADAHPFASYRRDAGLAFGHYRLGRRDEARRLALRACEHAGDGGYVRLRTMGLLLLATIEGPAGGDAIGRARAIAERLGDTELLRRVARRARAS